MELKVEDYAGKRRDTKRERELAVKLRQLPEEERYAFIKTLLQTDVVVGLYLANACLKQKSYFEALLQQGLQTADASAIAVWLEAVLPRLGFRRILALLTDALETRPVAVDKALYWLPRLLPENERTPEARSSLKDLSQQAKRKISEQRSHVESVSASV